jgi:hypothetical protein
MKMKRYAQLSLVPVLLGSPSPLLAGDIDSSTDPADTLSYTIGDICNRLDSGVAGSQISFTEPTADPAPTGCTLNEMMSKAPAQDNTNGAAPSEVANSKTFWGLRTDGTWGQQTGTSTATDTSSGDATAADIASGKKAWVDGSEITGNVPAGDNVTGTDGQKTITIPDALYSGSKTATANDTDLTVGNIKSGVNVFGVAGTYTGSIGGNVQDTSSGNAVAGEIFSGKKAWVDGSEITGTLATQTPTNTTVNQSAGNYSAFDLSTVDTDLAASNIKSGVTIFGVAGNFTGGPTCSGTLNGTRWCDNEDGTVMDMTTGLIWLKKADWGGQKQWEGNSNDNAHVRAGILKAGTTGANLSDSSVEGDWRLPTKTELVGITTGTESVSSSSMRAFSGVQPSNYWMATTDADNIGNAWNVNLTGDPEISRLKSNPYYVWPVRSRQ